jgi:hypothetical protein
MTHSRVGGTLGMGVAGVQVNGLLENAAQSADSLTGDPQSEQVDGGFHAPEGAVCVVCLEPLLPRHHARRGPAGLRHESCP